VRLGSGIRSRDPEWTRKGFEMIKDSLKGNGLGEVLQANSVPLTLIGIGIAWLVASNTGLADCVVNDQRVQAARRRIGELAGDVRIGGSSSEGYSGQILGPDGEPLAPTDADRGDGWVHQAAGAAPGPISPAPDPRSSVLGRAPAPCDPPHHP